MKLEESQLELAWHGVCRAICEEYKLGDGVMFDKSGATIHYHFLGTIHPDSKMNTTYWKDLVKRLANEKIDECDSTGDLFDYVSMTTGVDYFRVCDHCGKILWEYYYDGGTILCDDCLKKNYTDAEWSQECEENPDECYYSDTTGENLGGEEF